MEGARTFLQSSKIKNKIFSVSYKLIYVTDSATTLYQKHRISPIVSSFPRTTERMLSTRCDHCQEILCV